MGPSSFVVAVAAEVEAGELLSAASFFSPSAPEAAGEQPPLPPPPPPAPSLVTLSPPLNHACAWLISVTDAMGTPKTERSSRQIEARTGSPGSHALRISSTSAERASSPTGVSGYSPSCSCPCSSPGPGAAARRHEEQEG